MDKSSTKSHYVGLGLGCQRFSVRTEAEQRESVAIVRKAVESGITFLNTADFYNAGGSEMALGEALKGIDRDRVYVSLKFGVLKSPDGSLYGLDVHPDRVKNYLDRSLTRLKLDYVDLYQPARIDQAIPVEETVGAIAEMVRAGYVRHVGMTQVDLNTLKKAHATHPITFYEGEYSLFNRQMEEDIIPFARESEIDVVAFGILSHGLLGGSWTRERLGKDLTAYTQHIPLFHQGNVERNLDLMENLAEIAREKSCTLPQLALAWALAKGSDIVPLLGASKLAQFEESVKAREMKLSNEDIVKIEAAVPKDRIAGSSFPDMKFRDGRIM